MNKHQVIIVDDHQLMSKGISTLINARPDYEVIHEAKHGKELVQYLSNTKNPIPDIILLDINMPVMDGFKTMEWMQEHNPDIPVLALTINDDDASVINMLRLGVKGYLLKETDSEELVVAMETIINKGFYSSEIASQMPPQSISWKIRSPSCNAVFFMAKLLAEHKNRMKNMILYILFFIIIAMYLITL